jgi:hypothetical protein
MWFPEEALIKSCDRTSDKCLIPFVVDCKDAGVRATQEQLPRVCRTTCAPSEIDLLSASLSAIWLTKQHLACQTH